MERSKLLVSVNQFLIKLTICQKLTLIKLIIILGLDIATVLLDINVQGIHGIHILQDILALIQTKKRWLVLTQVSIRVSMCENLGIRANSSQATNHDLCERDLWLSLSNFDSTLKGLKIASRTNLESGPRFAKVCQSLTLLQWV